MTTKCSRRTYAAVITAVAGMTTVSPASDCTAIRWGTNDFDQVREAGPLIPGLPNDGVAFCYPTTWTSWMAYLNQQGFPLAMGLASPVDDWSGQDVYNLVTNLTELMGTYCETIPEAGTPTPFGVMDYLEHMGLADHFYLTEVTARFDDPQTVTPHLTVWDIQANMRNSGLVAITIAWTNVEDDIIIDAGGHVVGVTAVIGDLCQDATLLLRDPGSGGNGLTQSPYSYTDTTMTNVFGVFKSGDLFPQYKLLPQVDVYGDRQAFLIAMFTLYPTNAVSIPETQTGIALHRPWQFDDVSFPETEHFDFPTPWVLAARRMDLHPTGQGVVVLAEDESGNGRLLWFGYADESYQPVPDLVPDPEPLAVNRFGEVYFTSGGKLKWLGLGLEDGVIAPYVMGEASLELPLDDIMVSDDSDLVFGITGFEPSPFFVYDRSLHFVNAYPMPMGVVVEGTAHYAWGAGGKDLWLGSTYGANLHRLALGPDGMPSLVETIALPGPEGIDGLHVFDSGRVLVIADGACREYKRGEDDGWVESNETGFAGLGELQTIQVARSRTTAPKYDNPEDRPDWPHVRPEVDHPLCQADLDHDGVVDFADLLIVLSNWGPCELLCLGDANEDHDVTFADLLAVLSEWGPCP